MTITVAPDSTRRWNTDIRTSTSRGWSPMVGSSNTKTVPAWPRPISLASFRRWASPPERPGVASPSVRYPSPTPLSAPSLLLTAGMSLHASMASSTLILMISGRERLLPSLDVRTIPEASLR